MEVQVVTPSPAVDFNYDSTSTSPYATAPSSPQSTIPFTWEEKPGIPKHNNLDNSEQEYAETDSDFAFGYLERHSISAADELFDGGKIKPLKPPPRLHLSNDSPRSPKSPKLRFKEALSPRSKKHEFDPFSEALKQTSGEQTETDESYQPRGREPRTTKNTRCKVSRSLSPLRVSDIVNNRKTSKDQSSPAGLTWYNKWNLKNLLLFRSASEGSATTRKKNQSFSFRSADGGEPAEEVRGKTGLPYRSGLMGCLRFHQNAGSVHEISRGINSVMKR
ncbi:hypothetical protein L1987_49308 [Smallanthus sonchifolius]|uniref:Uncharacterized protein n=1 Tax=Smallanthus sonchifolius TaxID=185202 RepID=A0ACB9FVF5_9ASTR|nr:hypothetical protein L1987_49308 [Smallanthus sonchifolius]